MKPETLAVLSVAAAFLAVLSATLFGWLNLRQSKQAAEEAAAAKAVAQKIEVSVDGRLRELLAVTAENENAKGHESGRQQGRAELTSEVASGLAQPLPTPSDIATETAAKAAADVIVEAAVEAAAIVETTAAKLVADVK